MTLLNRQSCLRRFTGALLAITLASAWIGIPEKGNAQQADGKVEDILSYADLLFSKDQFGIAAQQYLIFIRENPESPNLQIAWFRLGECYLKVNQIEDAEKSFDFLISQYRRGPFVGSAAYRLAVLRFNQKDYQNALAYFKTAKDELTNPEAKLQAQFYYARCLQLTRKPKEALAQFEAILGAHEAEKNPFHERCLLESARLFFDLGDTAKALEKFKTLSETATTPEVREEAIVRGGLLAAEAGEVEVSEKLLNEALKFPDTSPWKTLAQVGAIFNAFTAGDYERVIGLYNTGAYTAPDESRAKMLLIVGHSFRIKGDLDSALRLYTLVEGKYPDRPEGIEAGYRRLQILHQKSDGTLPELAKRFAEKQRAIDPENPYIDMAYLMAAEWHFTQAETSASGSGSTFAKKHYGDAARAYEKVRLPNVDEKYREVSLYKTGWSEVESGSLEKGIITLTKFIKDHPESSLASSALAKRAVAYQTEQDHPRALADFQDLAKKYPEAPEVEFALQQIALIYAHQRKTPEMINAYQELLRQFPDTNGAGEAHYWIGVGYFNLEQHQQAIPELQKAREMDPEYEDKTTLRLVICHYQLENIDQLAADAKRYIENAPKADTEGKARTTIPQPVLEYLGKKLAAENDHERAEYFLTVVTDGADPSKTAASIWKLLAEARTKLKKHHEAIAAYDNFLLQTERPSERATAYLQRGISQFCLRDFEPAQNSAQESLRSQKEGRTNAEARILLGDVAAEQGNLAEAAREYVVVSQIFSDPEVTPRALSKAVKAYQALGDREKAQQLQQQLSSQFPNYDGAGLDYDC